MKIKAYITVMVVILVFTFLWLARAYYYSIPIQAYQQKSEAIVNAQSYNQGDDLSWTVTLCKLHDKEFYAQRSLVSVDSGKEFLIPVINTKATLTKGQCLALNPVVTIPKNSNMATGQYHLCSEIIVPDARRKILPFKYCTNDFIINVQE